MQAAINKVFKTHPDWPEVYKIIAKLKAAGHQAVLAGGCVRDAWLGIQPRDFDIATSAHPEQVEALFDRTESMGKAFGVIMVIEGHVGIEVATFRRDGEYSDGRRPNSVEYSTLKEDALRRDFTINALFFDVIKDELIDLVGGIEDLKRKQLRTVGDPEQRFAEDKLRPLRAIRFAARLGLSINPSTWNAIQKFAPQIERVSSERIATELRKMLQSETRVRALELMNDSGIWQTLFPEYKLEKTISWQDVLAVVEKLAGDRPLAALWLAILWPWREIPEVPERWLRKLKVSHDELSGVQFGLKALLELQVSSTRLGRRLEIIDSSLGPHILDMWLILDWRLGNGDQQRIVDTWQRYSNIQSADGHLPRPYLSGNDLRKQGFKPGPAMGKALREIYFPQLEGSVNSLHQAKDYGLKLL